MTVYIVVALGVGLTLFALICTVVLLWKLRQERETEMENLKAFAASLPEDERVIFWRLHDMKPLWKVSRYSGAFQEWKSNSLSTGASVPQTETNAKN